MNNSTAVSSCTWFKYLVIAAQTFFGAWFLIHGLNHWLQFFPQPPGSDSVSHRLISALIESGLFDWVKGAEIIGGIMLLSHRFIPLGFVLSVPPALVIAYMNIVLQGDPGSIGVGLTIFVLLALMAIGYFDAFKSLLRFKTNEANCEDFIAFIKRQ